MNVLLCRKPDEWLFPNENELVTKALNMYAFALLSWVIMQQVACVTAQQ